MNLSNATKLLARAAEEPNRVRRHLLVAAAIREAVASEPIVVGGLAEDYYTGDDYKPTDLDLCAPLAEGDLDRLRELGFQRDGRHWFHQASKVAVEFPDNRIDGDESRITEVDFGLGKAKIIGVDDLYLDRLRQATMTERENDIAFMGALAIAASRFEDIDWRYVKRRIARVRKDEPAIGESMARIDRLVRRRSKKAITG